MAQFFIPTASVDSTGHYYHPAIRHDLALDMSLKKLSDMKNTQRATHRPANLLKTVLVYNMFKAAVAPLPPVVVAPVADLNMEVDEPPEESGAAAEQSWFERCIDNMLTDDSQESMELPTTSFCIGDDDDEDDDEEEEFGHLKRSSSFQSLSVLGQRAQAVDGCLTIAAAAPVVAAPEDMSPAAWQKAGLWPTRDPQTIHANFFS